MTNGAVKKIIAETFAAAGVVPPATPVTHVSEPLQEAYVASPKQYDIPTESLPEEVKKAHVDLYKGYVKALNAVSAKLDTVPRKDANHHSSEFRALKGDEVFNMNAVYLHELYFANIGDVSSEILQDNLSFMRLARDFGTFDDWQRDFMACAMSAREGWAVCGYSTFLRRFVNFVVDLHDAHVPMGVYPVIVMDTWTHSMPLGMDRRSYVISMMREMNWEVIDNRFKRADRIAEALK